MTTLNLDTLDTNRHAVEKDGVRYTVEPVTPRIVSILDAADEATGAERVRGLADAVALILPTMPRAMVDGFSITKLFHVIKLAGTQVNAVEEYISDPNVQGSAVEQSPLPSDVAASTI